MEPSASIPESEPAAPSAFERRRRHESPFAVPLEARTEDYVEAAPPSWWWKHRWPLVLASFAVLAPELGYTGIWAAPVGTVAALVDLAQQRAVMPEVATDARRELFDAETGLMLDRQPECEAGVWQHPCEWAQEERVTAYVATVRAWVQWRGLPAYSEKERLLSDEQLGAAARQMQSIGVRSKVDLDYGVTAEVWPGAGLLVKVAGREAPVFRWPRMEGGKVKALAEDQVLFQVEGQQVVRSVDLSTGMIVQSYYPPSWGFEGRSELDDVAERLLYRRDRGPVLGGTPLFLEEHGGLTTTAPPDAPAAK